MKKKNINYTIKLNLVVQSYVWHVFVISAAIQDDAKYARLMILLATVFRIKWYLTFICLEHE